jgi:hypothetical protein
MPRLDPGIHASVGGTKTWMAGINPAMTAVVEADEPSPFIAIAHLLPSPVKQPAMFRHGFAISLRVDASFAGNVLPSKNQRAQGMPGARRARSLACKIKIAHEHSHHGHTGSPGIPRAMVLTVSFVLSPVTGLFCHRRRRNCFRQLDASVGASGPHDFAVRKSAPSS